MSVNFESSVRIGKTTENGDSVDIRPEDFGAGS